MSELKDTKKSWIGEIPTEWGLCRVKDLFLRRKEENQESDPVVLSLARSGVRVRDISNNEGQMAASYDKYHRVYKNDLMLNPMDLVSGANCSISRVEGVISPAYVNLVAKEKFVQDIMTTTLKLSIGRRPCLFTEMGCLLIIAGQ